MKILFHDFFASLSLFLSTDMVSSLYLVQNVEKRNTSTGSPYLILKLDNQLVSFFDEKDQSLNVQSGQQIECNVEFKGKYRNGHDLRIVSNGAPAVISPLAVRSPTPPNISSPPTPNINPNPAPSQKIKIPVDANGRTPLHRLSSAQLEQLYNHVCDSAESAYVGQISNQIRYAHLEELLTQLLQRLGTK